MHHEKNFQKQSKIRNIIRKIIPESSNRYMKIIPLLGIIILLVLSHGLKENNSSTNYIDEKMSVKDKFVNVMGELGNSFNFSDGLAIITTIIILITLWTGYKYWLLKWKYINRNSRLLEKLIIIFMVIIFLVRHIQMNSLIGNYVDWALFLLFLYLVVAGSWFLAKTIDGIDLSSDLYCWGLRLIGGIVAFFGIMLFLSSTFALTFSNSTLVFNNIYWIASICIILFGAFMEYRSFRRHPAIHVW